MHFRCSKTSVFELSPGAKKMFNYSDEEDIRANPTFMIHARSMFDMIDSAVGFLGPDLDPLTEDLIELGKRHVGYGVEAQYLPIMGKALEYALEETLGAKFTRRHKESWHVVFEFMISKMEIGIKKITDVRYNNVMDVTESWDKLKMTPNYQDVAGELIFAR
jgi:hemoglobin-like flavoprotein